MAMREFDLAHIDRDETLIVRLPFGRLLEIEWLDSEANCIRVVGFENQDHYSADEQYRLAGYEPLLRCFCEHVPMTKIHG
jgi:hypothetical protein